MRAARVPKGTPKPIVDQLAAALDDEMTRTRLIKLGCDIPDKPQRGPAALLALVKAQIARWSPIIKAAGVSMNWAPARAAVMRAWRAVGKSRGGIW